MPRHARAVLTLALSALLLAALALPALAHVTVSPDTAAAGGYAKVDLRVPHGCDGSPTTAVRVSIPDGVTAVKPQVVAGWEIETVIGDLAEPVEQHGQTITEGVREIVWRGGPLPDEHLQEFGISLKLPEGEAGDVVWFPVVQECEEGESAWITIPDSLDAWGGTDMPAPYVELTAAAGGHGAPEPDEAADADMATATAADLAVAPPPAQDGTDPLVLVALALGLAGLGLGGAAFASTRRTRTPA